MLPCMVKSNDVGISVFLLVIWLLAFLSSEFIQTRGSPEIQINLVLRRKFKRQRKGKGAPYGVLGRGGEIVSTAKIVEKAQGKRRHILGILGLPCSLCSGENMSFWKYFISQPFICKIHVASFMVGIIYGSQKICFLHGLPRLGFSQLGLTLQIFTKVQRIYSFG